MDIRENKPWTKNQVTQEKPNIKKTFEALSGYFASSMNGGHNKTIGVIPVMAGTPIKEIKLPSNWQLLTPLTPAFQNLNLTIRTYFVPNSRVWKNAEKFTGQLNNATGESPMEEPNIGGKKIPTIINNDGDKKTLLTDTTIWRDSFISSYIIRFGGFESRTIESQFEFYDTLPKITVLGLRGRVAIYNDFERNKQYDEEETEYDTDEVSEAEWNSYLPLNKNKYDFYTMRAKMPDSYYSDYRTSIQGFSSIVPEDGNEEFEINQNYGIRFNPATSLISWANWESYIAEARSQAENSMGENPWDVIAQIRGSKKLTEGKVQLIGQKTIQLNYSAITQSAYNNNDEVREDFRVMGKQGAYSFTNINEPIAAGFIVNEEGYIHIIATVSADTIYESGIDRQYLNVEWDSKYRPDLKDKKLDVLYRRELNNYGYSNNINMYEYIGFKRAFTEYFKIPNCIGGDMTSKGYFEINMNRNTDESEIGYYFEGEYEVIPNNTYQFFLTGDQTWVDYDQKQIIPIKRWKDNTDLMINKNQAIKNEVTIFYTGYQDDTLYQIMGNNQIFFSGIIYCECQLPIDEEIKNNYTKWGEH